MSEQTFTEAGFPGKFAPKQTNLSAPQPTEFHNLIDRQEQINERLSHLRERLGMTLTRAVGPEPTNINREHDEIAQNAGVVQQLRERQEFAFAAINELEIMLERIEQVI